jgi:hypothetical protein
LYNTEKVKVAAMRIAFLMHHQEVLPDLKIIASKLVPSDLLSEEINKESNEYLIGAMDALLLLIHMLEKKGPQINE